MCLFFNSLKTKDVQSHYEKLWKGADLPGFPSKAYRNYDNFRVSPYNVLKKDSCNCTMHVHCGKWYLHFNAYYDRKKKETHFTVWFMNLTISNRQLEDAIKQTYPEFSIGFMPSAVIISSKKNYVAKKIEDIDKAFNTFFGEWKRTQIYEFMTGNFKTNEELKAEGKIK